MRANRCRSGLTLIEVLLALAILGIASAAWAGQMGESFAVVRTVHARDAEIESATALLARISVWPNARFAATVGERRVDGFRLSIRMITPSLFDVTVSDTLRGTPLLHTSFYAPGIREAR